MGHKCDRNETSHENRAFYEERTELYRIFRLELNWDTVSFSGSLKIYHLFWWKNSKVGRCQLGFLWHFLKRGSFSATHQISLIYNNRGFWEKNCPDPSSFSLGTSYDVLNCHNNIFGMKAEICILNTCKPFLKSNNRRKIWWSGIKHVLTQKVESFPSGHAFAF